MSFEITPAKPENIRSTPFNYKRRTNNYNVGGEQHAESHAIFKFP